MPTELTRRKALLTVGLAATAGAMGLSGCNDDESTQTDPVESPQVQITPVEGEGIDPMMGFAADTTAALFDCKQGALYSPASLYLDLGMVGIGATGNSQAEILQAMRAANSGELSTVLRTATDDFAQPVLEESTSLHVACSTWTDEDCPVNEEFAALTEKVCDAQVKTVSFGTSSANQAMTDWVSEQTQGLLSPQFETEDPSDGNGTAMILLNTVYIKPNWIDPFDEESNVKEEFTNASGEKVEDVEYMCQENMQTAFKGDGYAVASRSFKVDVSALYDQYYGEEGTEEIDEKALDDALSKATCHMAFLLPDEGTALSDVLNGPQAWLDFLTVDPQEEYKVLWKLPKIDLSQEFSLIGTLQSLGVQAPFAPNKDFKEMVNTPETSSEYISEVRQGTRLTLNEEGAEAAAYTEIGMKTTSVAPGFEKEPETLYFYCDRPIAFALFAAGRVLFTGVYNGPGN